MTMSSCFLVNNCRFNIGSLLLNLLRGPAEAGVVHRKKGRNSGTIVTNLKETEGWSYESYPISQKTLSESMAIPGSDLLEVPNIREYVREYPQKI